MKWNDDGDNDTDADDDNSNDENRLEEEIKQFTFSIKLIVISKEEKGDRINPCIAYNRGFAEATGEIIMIQNPECYHQGDIINHTLKNFLDPILAIFKYNQELKEDKKDQKKSKIEINDLDEKIKLFWHFRNI